MHSPTLPLPRAPLADEVRRGAVAFALALGVFVALGVAAAWTGVFARLPAPVIPAFVLSFTVALCVWYRRSRSLRAFAWSVPLPALVLFHGVRAFIGADFLRLLGEGRLPESFAYHAGIGDIVSGVLALVVLLPLRGDARRRVLWGWNALALLDIATVMVTAQVSVLGGDPLLRAAFAQPPYGAIPFLLVLVFTTHIFIFVRLRHERASEGRSA